MLPFLLFAYRLPSEPSAPRVALWRALKKLGGAYVNDGAFLTRNSEQNLVTLRDLSASVRNDGGVAAVLEIVPMEDERHLLAMRQDDEPKKKRS